MARRLTSDGRDAEHVEMANALAAMKPEWGIGEASTALWKRFVGAFQRRAALIVFIEETPPGFVPEYEERLDDMMIQAFPTNHPAMHDYARLKMELKQLRTQEKPT